MNRAIFNEPTAIAPLEAALQWPYRPMDKYLKGIDAYLNETSPDFWAFYKWFQDVYFGNTTYELRKQLKTDETELMTDINDALAYAGTDPTPDERHDGIMDQDEFLKRLKELKEQNIQIWRRHGL